MPPRAGLLLPLRSGGIQRISRRAVLRGTARSSAAVVDLVRLEDVTRLDYVRRSLDGLPARWGKPAYTATAASSATPNPAPTRSPRVPAGPAAKLITEGSGGAGRRPIGAKQGPQPVGGDRPRVANGLADVGRPTGSEAFDEVCEVGPQIPRVGRLQPDLPAAVCPPDLEIGNRSLRRPVFALARQQQNVDETSDAQADVHEDPDRTRPGNFHHGALEDLPEAQVPPNPRPLGIYHHEQIITPSSVCRSGTSPPSMPASALILDSSSEQRQRCDNPRAPGSRSLRRPGSTCRPSSVGRPSRTAREAPWCFGWRGRGRSCGRSARVVRSGSATSSRRPRSPLTTVVALALTSFLTAGCGAGVTPASAAEEPREIRAKGLLEQVPPDSPEFVESGLERLRDGVHARSTLTQDRGTTFSR